MIISSSLKNVSHRQKIRDNPYKAQFFRASRKIIIDINNPQFALSLSHIKTLFTSHHHENVHF